MEKIHRRKILLQVFIIYILCFVFRIFEYFFLHTDRTLIGEAIVHKLIGIAIMLIAMKQLQLTLMEIGYTKENVWKNLLKGLAFGVSMFIIAYAAEIVMVVLQGKFDSLQIYVSTYAVDRNVGNQTAVIFFLICIMGNIINVLMEEGIFRGLFMKVLEDKYSFIISAIITSCLFGLWHMVGPVRNYCEGISSMGGMIANIIMLVVTSGLVGFKFTLLTKMTGNLYMAMGDHFVNNTIVNLLHVVSDTGADELMFIRLTIAQSVSFIVVLVCYIHRCCKKA